MTATAAFVSSFIAIIMINPVLAHFLNTFEQIVDPNENASLNESAHDRNGVILATPTKDLRPPLAVLAGPLLPVASSRTAAGEARYPIACKKPRLYDATNGDIFAEGRDISDISPARRRGGGPDRPGSGIGRPVHDPVAGQINGRRTPRAPCPGPSRAARTAPPRSSSSSSAPAQSSMHRDRRNLLADINEADATRITRRRTGPSGPPFLGRTMDRMDDKVITDFVNRITQGNLRNVTPYSAATN